MKNIILKRLVFLFLSILVCSVNANTNSISEDIELLLARYSERDLSQYSESSTDDIFNTSELREIIAIGPEAIPFLVNKLSESNTNHSFICNALKIITKKNISYGIKGKSKSELWVEWWRQGKVGSIQKYKAYINEWLEIKRLSDGVIILSKKEYIYNTSLGGEFIERSSETEAGKLFRALEAMGLEILPSIVEELKSGRYEFIQIAQHLMDLDEEILRQNGSLYYGEIEERAKFVIDYWENTKSKFNIPLE